MPEDAAVGRKQFLPDRAETRTKPTAVCHLLQSGTDNPACSHCVFRRIQQQAGSSGCEPGGFGSQGQLGNGMWGAGWSVQQLGLLSCAGWCCALSSLQCDSTEHSARSHFLTLAAVGHRVWSAWSCFSIGQLKFGEGNKGKYSHNPSPNIHMGCQSSLVLA